MGKVEVDEVDERYADAAEGEEEDEEEAPACPLEPSSMRPPLCSAPNPSPIY